MEQVARDAVTSACRIAHAGCACSEASQQTRCRPGESQDPLPQMPIVVRRWGHDPVHNQIRWLWVLAFARTTVVRVTGSKMRPPRPCGARRGDQPTSVAKVMAAYAGCFVLASIWPIASTTASKVRRVEAWRAL